MKDKHERPDADAAQTQAGVDKVSRSASTTDCTGLSPSGVVDDAQSEAYGELYDIHPPKAPHAGQPRYKH
jgi:hypothetical protein